LKRIVVATSNPGKVRELALALAPTGLEILGLEALSDPSTIEETGATFEANARLKAESYSLRTKLPVLAEDSGIEVDGLGGAPGVLSARYGGAGLSDADRNLELLEALRDVPRERRTARFRSVIAIGAAGKTLATFEGVVSGLVLEAPRGDHGFGYDPIFFHEEAGCFGELATSEKERYSHRGRAIRAFVDALRGRDSRLLILTPIHREPP
jgi:XTP/dITP diphosphohydrolase